MTKPANKVATDCLQRSAASEKDTPLRQPTSGRSDNRQIVINAGSNAGVMIVKVIVAFVASPILVHSLGDSRYGIWMFISSITAYFGLGDLGVKSAILRFVARYDGLHDDVGINRVVNTSAALLTCMALLILAITFAMAWFWRIPLTVTAELFQETRWFFVLSGILVALLMLVSVPQALLGGLGRFPVRNAISVVSLIVRQVGMIAVVWCGGNLVAVGAFLIGIGMLDFGALYWAARRCFPRLAFANRFVDREMVRLIWGYGIHVSVGDIAFLAMGQSAPLIVGAFCLSAESITYFTIGASLHTYALSILSMMVFVLTPAVSKWEATSNQAAIRALFVHATRYALYFIAPIECGLLIFGYPFLSLWMGRRYADASYTTLVLLTIPVLLSAAGVVATRILQGLGRVRVPAILTVVQAVLTIAFSVALVRPYGIEGVACGISLAVVLIAPVTTVLACYFVQLGLTELMLRAVVKPLLTSAVAVLTWMAARQVIPIDSWGKFLTVGVLGMIPYCLIVLAMEPDVRDVAGAVRARCSRLLYNATRLPAGWLGIERD